MLPFADGELTGPGERVVVLRNLVRARYVVVEIVLPIEGRARVLHHQLSALELQGVEAAHDIASQGKSRLQRKPDCLMIKHRQGARHGGVQEVNIGVDWRIV